MAAKIFEKKIISIKNEEDGVNWIIASKKLLRNGHKKSEHFLKIFTQLLLQNLYTHVFF